MRKITVLLVIILAMADIGYADIFTKDNANPYTIDNAISEDRSGFYYRGGVDYNPPVSPEAPGVGYSIISGSKGCSGFDLASSFTSTFSSQVLTDYLKNISSSAMAAAPMLLLEYASPTLADIIKHFSAMTNMRLGLRYAQCEDIEKAAGEYMDKLRKKSEDECVKEKQSQGIDIDSALKACKEGKDPFAFLKNAEGIPLAQGGKIDILADIFKKINIPEQEFIKVQNSKTEYTILRKDLSHCLLKILSENVDVEYPQEIFELGTIFNSDYTESEHLSLALSPGNFTKAKQILEYLGRMLNLENKLKVDNHSGQNLYCIEGRIADVILNNKEIGLIGDVHPSILKNFKIKMPVTLIEIDLAQVFKII